MKVTICNCNPGVSHQRITDTDAAKIRRLRKHTLEQARWWEKYGDETDKQYAICARYTAYQCLLRLRELRQTQGVTQDSFTE
jgi:hypothetical protein